MVIGIDVAEKDEKKALPFGQCWAHVRVMRGLMSVERRST